MADHSELDSQKQQPPSHQLPSLDHQQSIYSLTLDEFHNTFSDGNRSFGSMNMDELLDNIGTAEEIQAYTQTPVTNNTTALATTAAPTTNFNPPEGTNNIQQGLPNQGSLTLPALLRQKTVDEVWFEIHNFQEPDTTVNVEKVGSEATYGEMTLEEFLIKAGVIRGQDHPPKQTCEPHQSNNTVQLESGYVARPVMALGGSGNAHAYAPLPQSSSARDAASVAVGQIPVQCQPQEVCCYDKRMQNNIDGGGYVQVQGSPVTPISSDDAGANQANSVNQTRTEDVDGEKRWSGPVEKVVARRQRRMIKNRESAARSRARKQAYTLELEAELKMLKEENDHLKQMEQERKIQLELERKRLKRERKRLEQERKSQSLKQNIEKKLKARKTTSTKTGLKRNWSWPCVDDMIPQ